MKSDIKSVAVIGTGVIGAGWIIRCLAHNKKVVAFDKDLKLKKRLVAEIKRTWPYVKKLFNKKKINLKNFKYVTSIEKALKDYKNRIKVTLVPNITNICYGRGVGYKIEEIVLDEKTQQISATKIREQMRKEGKLK